MTDDDDIQLPATTGRLPALRAPELSRPSVPSLPHSSGAIFGFPTTILTKDTAYVDAHAGLLRARADQARAMRELVDEQELLALTVSRLVALPELAQHEYLKAKLERAAELRITELKLKTGEINAEIRLLTQQQQLAALKQSFAPPPPPPAPSPAPAPSACTGLTPAEIEQVLAHLPEIPPELRKHLLQLLAGRLSEKKETPAP